MFQLGAPASFRPALDAPQHQRQAQRDRRRAHRASHSQGGGGVQKENGVFIGTYPGPNPGPDQSRHDDDDDGDDYYDGRLATAAFMLIVVVSHLTQPARNVLAGLFKLR